ncbi:hypothetical protein O181_010784 [Austropuccinia psidii MF-1]|uniref:Uncharacterized protein n=1 Tax=Austropuccinia psidii MF-1 TaxID=1389203 RepID=A0A9Q3GL76_9BASI|nr:hypothetical protein [Austropuccinia psidii MF-1]
MHSKIFKKQTSPPSRKRSPNQVLNSEIPEAFQRTKKAFYEHIKILWGLIYQHSIPILPDYSMLKEFNCCSSFLSDIEAQSENPNTQPLVPLDQIITLQGTKPGKKKIGNAIVHMSDFAPKYIISLLARLGIRRWAPDLNNASDTLYNEACRISAIQIFRQIAISGEYKYMNVNFSLLENIQLLTKVYNHYIHWYMTQRYKKEAKESGKHLKDEGPKAVLQYRLRLKTLRYKFGVSENFPKQYLKILANPDAHSEDEYDPIKNIYTIKRMECWSENANVFLCRVDEGISKAEGASGKGSQRSECHLPAPGEGSISKKVPNQLPRDFTILIDASKCLLEKQHPDERLSDKQFTQKYWDQKIEPYDISHVIENDDELDVDSNTNDKSYELEDIAAEEFEDKNDEESKQGNTHMEKPNNYSEDIEMEDCEDDDTPQQSQQSFFSIQNEWSSW